MDRADHLGEPVKIAVATQADDKDWLALRYALWPDSSLAEHAKEIAEILAKPGSTLALIARAETGEAVGFAEASLRHDYVNGCDSSPVAFLEGIYVAPAFRGQGFARQLVAAVQTWAEEHGCTELASDANIANSASHAMHRSLGFAETQRVVYFRKMLSGSGD